MYNLRSDRLTAILLSKFNGTSKNRCIPILMYHSISKNINRSVTPYYSTEITPVKFEQHLNFLLTKGYRICRLGEIAHLLKEGQCTRDKIAIITFDDGYQNFYDYALPILSKYNTPATLFIPSGLIKNSEHSQFEGLSLMNWVHVKECADQKIVEIGSHSLMHGSLTMCTIDNLKKELYQSKKIIEDQIQKEVTLFSYPYRFPDENKVFVSLLCTLYKQYGYKICVTTRIGRVIADDNMYLLKRLPVNEYDDLELFGAKLNGCYDWLYTLQYVVKVTRSLLKNRKVTTNEIT